VSDKFGIKTKGIERLEKKLKRSVNTRELAKAVLRPAAEEIRDEAGAYPPQLAPTPGAKTRYIRGAGTMYIPTGRIQRTSETLGKRWLIATQPARARAIIHNYASYAPFVHGKRQWIGHKHHGWKQLHAVAKEKLPQIGRDVVRAFRRLYRQ
jgi:hypothetical protein